MDLHVILTLIAIPLDMAVVGFAIYHLLKERKERPAHPSQARSDQPSLRKIIITLFLLAGIALPLVSLLKPGAFLIVKTYWSLITTGVMLTVTVSVLSIVFGTIAGVLIALIIGGRKSVLLSTLVNSPVMSVLYVLLGIPALILLYVTYYGGIQSIFWAAVVALSINLTPFVAKIVSASIRNISQEQIDSAIAFGYSPLQIALYFKIGFVIRTSLQPLLVEYYTTIKLSSFAGLIGLTEIYHASQEIIKETQDPVTSYIVLASAYVVIVTPLAILADYFERKWKKAIA
jgi:ABC-type amino acid transport system permease subunit